VVHLVTVLAVTAIVALGADRAVGARIALSGLALGSIMIATHLVETNRVRYGPRARRA